MTTYDLAGIAHTISDNEINSVYPGLTWAEYATTPSPPVKDALLVELITLADFRPGKTTPGTRPPARAQRRLPEPLSEAQKGFALTNFRLHPINIIAAAMQINSYAVKHYLHTRGHRKGPPASTMYGDLEVELLAAQYRAYASR